MNATHVRGYQKLRGKGELSFVLKAKLTEPESHQAEEKRSKEREGER